MADLSLKRCDQRRKDSRCTPRGVSRRRHQKDELHRSAVGRAKGDRHLETHGGHLQILHEATPGMGQGNPVAEGRGELRFALADVHQQPITRRAGRYGQRHELRQHRILVGGCAVHRDPIRGQEVGDWQQGPG